MKANSMLNVFPTDKLTVKLMKLQLQGPSLAQAPSKALIQMKIK
jgi:hypothetical protein